MRTALLAALALLLAACAPSLGDDDGAPPGGDDDDDTGDDDDDATGDDDDDSWDDDDIADDDDDPCAGYEWSESDGDPGEAGEVLPGLGMSPAEVVAEAGAAWRGEIEWLSGSAGDDEGLLQAVPTGAGWAFREGGGPCSPAIRIPYTLAFTTPSCSLAALAAGDLWVIGPGILGIRAGWSEDWSAFEGDWTPDFDPDDWDAVSLDWSFDWVFPKVPDGEPPWVDLGIQISASRATPGGGGEGMVGFVAQASLFASEAGLPDGWAGCVELPAAD